MKIVINRCFGGFGISKSFFEKYGIPYEKLCASYYYNGDAPFNERTDKRLIEYIEKYGSRAASGDYAELKVVEIPDDVEWEIDEYDDMEIIEEVHRSWC